VTRERTVLITGASTGIGEACARRLDLAGWRVFAGVRTPDAGELLRAGTSSRLEPVLLDVTDDEQVADLGRSLDERLGPNGLDGLVNNAGIGVGGPIEYVPIEVLRQQLEVNVIGPVRMVQAAREPLRRAHGRIAMIGSIAGRISSPVLGPYASSKHALAALTESLRSELHGAGIRVALIEPGAVATPIWDKASEQAAGVRESLPPVGRARYDTILDKVEQNLLSSAAHAVPADRVATAVEHALTRRWPKSRYLVGPDARIAATLLRVLPDRARAAMALRI